MRCRSSPSDATADIGDAGGGVEADRGAIIGNLSARVGSISDNKLGGWWSYRMSKAALNMATVNMALELKRTSSVEGALANFTKMERLSGENQYRCVGCADLVDASKRLQVCRRHSPAAPQPRPPCAAAPPGARKRP